MIRRAVPILAVALLVGACEGPSFNPPPEIPIRAAEGTEDVVAVQFFGDGARTSQRVTSVVDTDIALRIGDDGCEGNLDVIEIRPSLDSEEVLDTWDLSERPLCLGDRLLWTGENLELMEHAP